MSIVSKDDKFISLYADPDRVIYLAKKRVSLLLYGLNLLYSAVGTFGLTTFTCLVGSFLSITEGAFIPGIKNTMIALGGLGMLLLFAAVMTFIRESSIARAMVKLHIELKTH